MSNNEARSLFLLCGLLGYRDIPMGHLLKYSIGLALLEGVDTLEKGTDKLHWLVDHLRASSLLLHAEDDNYVRMHDVVRDVAVEIASKDHHWFALREGVRLKDWSKMEEPEECFGISLNCKTVYELPEGLVCPKLNNEGESSSSVFPCVDEISEGTSGGPLQDPTSRYEFKLPWF